MWAGHAELPADVRHGRVRVRRAHDRQLCALTLAALLFAIIATGMGLLASAVTAARSPPCSSPCWAP
jgi:hypothetical protein